VLSIAKNILQFAGHTPSEFLHAWYIRGIEDVENLHQGLSKGLGDRAALADKRGSRLVLGGKLGRGLHVRNAWLFAVEDLLLGDCIEIKGKKYKV